MKKSDENRTQQEAPSPAAARKEFLDNKRETVKESSYRVYKHPTNHFVEFCRENGVGSINEVASDHVEAWVQKRESEDIAPITAKNTVKHVRVFLKWCENAGLIEPGIYSNTRVPDVSEDEEASNEALQEDDALQILDYLSTYEYASRQHALFAFLWETGCRVSDAIAVDVDDLVTDSSGDPAVRFRDRPEQGTGLKHGEKSERTVMVSGETRELLGDYIEMRRPQVTDEYGREPLFCTEAGRIKRQRVYKSVVAFTRPCVFRGDCPAGMNIEDCEAARRKDRAMSCPVNSSLRSIRRGSITKHINRGWPKRALSERVDVSPKSLTEYYDESTHAERAERRRDRLLDF